MTDKNRVKTVVLSNNDRFYFSWKYDDALLAQYIEEAKCLYYSFNEIPVLPQIASQIQEDIIIRSIHGTAAIEGNPLSEEEVKKVLSYNSQRKAVKRAEQEILNLKKVYIYLQETTDFPELTYDSILGYQGIITDKLDSSRSASGKIRSHVVRVGDSSHGGTYKPPSRHMDIQRLMEEYVTFINSKSLLSLDPIIQGVLAHYHLALIHPFEDGNGRTARFLEAYIIRSSGMKFIPALLSNYYYQHMDDYYWAFSFAEKSKVRDVTPFLDFVFQGVIESLHDIKSKVYTLLRKSTLISLYNGFKNNRNMSQRQHDLLLILLEQERVFQFQELYSNPIFSIIYRSVSERTAQRDLKKLVTMDLLKKNEDGTYELNLRALG